MHPVLGHLHLGGTAVTVGSYSAMMLLGLTSMVLVGAGAARWLGIAWPRALAVFAAAVVAGVLGARVFDLATLGQLAPAEAHLIAKPTLQAFALYGGLGAGALVVLVLARLWRLPLWRLADAAVPAVAVGVAFMRTGCFMRGCCFGERTDLPWGVAFPPGSPAWAHQLASGQSGLFGFAGGMEPVHPTQLYELIAVLGIAVVALIWRRKRDIPDGSAFLAFAIGFTLFRLGNDSLRVSSPGASAPSWFYPTLYALVVIALGVVLATRLSRRGAAAVQDAHAETAAVPPPLPGEKDAAA
jgi:phosphatidylglycerol:prolipoprotein diacylglycerol transferase